MESSCVATPFLALFSRALAQRWKDVVVEQHHFSSVELADVMPKQHVMAITIGPSATWEFKKAGRFRRIVKARDAISFFPSHQPFSGRLKVERDALANVLFLALDPVFREARC
jgi:hypothetical protein